MGTERSRWYVRSLFGVCAPTNYDVRSLFAGICQICTFWVCMGGDLGAIIVSTITVSAITVSALYLYSIMYTKLFQAIGNVSRNKLARAADT